MMEKKRSLTFFLISLFISGTLPITNPVSADGEADNWPENDAWLRIELISWSANDSVEWDNGGGLPDPIFKICVEADGDNLDCINTPTWENQLTLNNSWNYSMDIPDDSAILNITIECEDNDAFNDDECDMNSDVNYWRLYAEYNWSATPSLTISGDGDDDDDVTWKNAASTWRFIINGFGDEDEDGITDNIDLCSNTIPFSETLQNRPGCAWGQIDNDLDGVVNLLDPKPDDYNINGNHFHGAGISSWGNHVSEKLEPYGHFYLGDNSNHHSEIRIYDRNSDGYPDIHPSAFFDIDQNGFLDSISKGGEVFLINLNPGQNDSYQIQLDSTTFCDLNTHCTIKFADLGRDGRIEMISDTGIHQFNGDSFSSFAAGSEMQYCGGHYGFSPSHIYEPKTNLDVILCPHGGMGHRVLHLNGSSIEHNFLVDTSCPQPCTGTSVGLWDETGGIGDINNDGYIDLIRNEQSGVCVVYLGNQNGISNDSLDLPSAQTQYCPGPLEIIDIDLNGEIDIVSQNGIVFQNDGLFESIGYRTPAGILPKVVDWDQDGDLDILLVQRKELRETPTDVFVLYNPSFVDSDSDGVADDVDLCPSTPLSEIVNVQGCSQSEIDDDADDVFNDVDLCPNTNLNMDVNEEGCSDEQLDDDGDGLNNALDQCPDTPQGDSVNLLGCSFEDSQDLDSDNDGVLDSEDACPETEQGVTVDSLGCDVGGGQTMDVDSDGDGVYDRLDECHYTANGVVADFKGCPMDSDSDGIYDGLDECPSTDTGKEVDSTGCFSDSAGSDSDAGSAALGCFWIIAMISLVVFVVRKVRGPKQQKMAYQQPTVVAAPVQRQSVPIPQISSRERQLENQSRQAQIEAQRLRQELANQAQITQQLQMEAAQKQMSEAALAQKQHELAIAQQEKEQLEAKLAEAEKNTPIVQNITYNITDSAISGDITNKINRDDLE